METRLIRLRLSNAAISCNGVSGEVRYNTNPTAVLRVGGAVYEFVCRGQSLQWVFIGAVATSCRGERLGYRHARAGTLAVMERNLRQAVLAAALIRPLEFTVLHPFNFRVDRDGAGASRASRLY